MQSANHDRGQMLCARGIKKSFGSQKVLANLDFELPCGQVQLLLGANGAGKSTLLRILGGLAKPDAGKVEYPGAGTVNMVGHQLFLYLDMSVRENLKFFAALCKSGGSVEQAEQEWDLSELAGRPVRDLSRGQQVRVSLARAFLSRPKFLLLDEPSAALDDKAVDLLCANLRAFMRDGSRAVAIASHDIERLAAIANCVKVLEGGVFTLNAGASEEQRSQAIAHYRLRNR